MNNNAVIFEYLFYVKYFLNLHSGTTTLVLSPGSTVGHTKIQTDSGLVQITQGHWRSQDLNPDLYFPAAQYSSSLEKMSHFICICFQQ